MIEYVSTRGHGPENFENALLHGLAPDGGLYVPTSWPKLNLEALKGLSYVEVAEWVMFPFVEGCIEKEAFRDILEECYAPDIFLDEAVAPLRQIQDGLYILELFHGPTIAFKDFALQFLGRLFDHVLDKRDERITVIGATSGDTGSAAIEGCRHSDRINIFILHPHGRVSEVQRRQMTTVDAPNVHNIALEGTFDDCQNAVKAMFNDPAFRARHNLSAVNSINWARIMAQIVYYVTAALRLGAPEQPISFVVPTGNFGNIYAAYAARQMGLPIRTLALATNKNDILTRFFETGEMKTQNVEATISPSMDIQISSNFERYLFDICGHDAKTLKDHMMQFQKTGALKLPAHKLEIARREFSAFRASEEETGDTIRGIFEEADYLLDPHSAVGMHVALKLKEKAEGAVVTLGCAHPAKFPDAVERATGVKPQLPDHLSDLLQKPEYMDVLENDLETIKTYIVDRSTK